MGSLSLSVQFQWGGGVILGTSKSVGVEIIAMLKDLRFEDKDL